MGSLRGEGGTRMYARVAAARAPPVMTRPGLRLMKEDLMVLELPRGVCGLGGAGPADMVWYGAGERCLWWFDTMDGTVVCVTILLQTLCYYGLDGTT